ncbi:MAG: hypothetical protein IKQ23_07750, partial [Treponema sp.]|nr:hypothetical protein [Treponema sp.]
MGSRSAASSGARHLVAIQSGDFSQEKSRVKMPRRVFLPAFRGFSTAKAVPLRAATIGRRLHRIRPKENNQCLTYNSS